MQRIFIWTCKSVEQRTLHHQQFVLKNFEDLVSVLCSKYLSTIPLSYKRKRKSTFLLQ